ncbi:MAG: recombinase RecA [Phycisphaerae bacterium]|nr:recombinase RecA [Phycisphaerae bacterium]
MAARAAKAKAKPQIQADDGQKKEEVLQQALQHITKVYGKGAIMQLDSDLIASVPGISTGSLSLDLALGGRGVPKGRVIEMFGPESSGKTTLALAIIASAQRENGVAAFIDAEHALDPTWAKRVGVNLEALLVSQPDTGEQALDIAEMLVRTNAVDVIVIDSVAALIPEAEIKGEMIDQQVGVQARLMSKALRKLTGAIHKSNTCVIFINQLRQKIGVMYGNPETTPGGMALKFYSSVRIDIRRISSIKEGERTTGNRVRAKVVKNKVAPPFRMAEFDIMFDRGVDPEGDLLDLAVEEKIVDKSGAWFTYGETKVGQGREAAKQFLRDNADVMAEIRQQVLDKKGVDEAAVPSASDEELGGDDDGDEVAISTRKGKGK